VSGTFYPADATTLRRDVETYLGTPAADAPRVPAVIAPHAGYVYSGSTAGAVFATIHVPATCIVLAPNHSGLAGAGRGGSVLLSACYETPLGEVGIDLDLGALLMEAAGTLLADDPVAHRREHGAEVVLPFLQVRNPVARIVPIVLAWSRWEDARSLAAAIHRVVGPRDDVLVVASSDMNHYESAARTRLKDEVALDRVRALDGEGLLTATSEHHITMCGRVPAACACEYARLRGGQRGEVIAYSHSGLVNGDERRVVGYAGVLLGSE
jgi:AmmeMemoRadiSam system protein B